jgi:hypothetical protein
MAPEPSSSPSASATTSRVDPYTADRFRFQSIAVDAGAVHDQGGEAFEAMPALIFRQSELAQVQHGKLGGMPGALRLFAKAGAHFENPDRLGPQTQQVLDHIVQVGASMGRKHLSLSTQ